MTKSQKPDKMKRRSIRWRLVPWVLSIILLLLAGIATVLTDRMNWDETDFLVMGLLLFGACGVLELTARLRANAAYRAAVFVAVAATSLLIWINLAVGIIGSEDNPANLMYLVVIAVPILGAFLAGTQPKGMARALLATAIAQTVVAVIALSAGLGSTGANWPQVIFVLNGFFAALWLISAWLFTRASQELVPTSPSRAQPGS